MTVTQLQLCALSVQGGESAATSASVRASKPLLTSHTTLAAATSSYRAGQLGVRPLPRGMTASAADTVAPLLRLNRALMQAFELARFARALELSGRALAAAEATLPGDSLVVASLLRNVIQLRTSLTEDVVAAAQTTGYADALMAAWARDEQVLPLSQRCLALLHARWRVGSLLSLSPEEAAFFADGLDIPYPGAEAYIKCASDAACCWPALPAPADEEARVRGVHGVLRAALDLQRRGGLNDVKSSTLDALKNLLTYSLLGPPHGLLHKLRSACDLTLADEIALRQLQQRNDALRQGTVSAAARLASIQERGAEDVAHHGLRRCALPTCGDTEPHPKLFKLCGRCRGAAYCCAGHSKEDWKRHKREDGCKAASS
jgi:hypothetical protein